MILDTNALSDWAKSDDGLLRILPPPTHLTLPVIVVAEYLAGAYRSPQRRTLEAWIRHIMTQLVIAAADLPVAERYAEVAADLERQGQTIPSNDMWIAAIALERRLPLLSRDRHFDRVEGLTRISW